MKLRTYTVVAWTFGNKKHETEFTSLREAQSYLSAVGSYWSYRNAYIETNRC